MSRSLEARVLDHPADHVELALEGVLVVHAVAGGHEQLRDVGRAARAAGAAGALVHRHVAPAQHALALGLDGALDQLERASRAASSLGRKHIATP